MSEERNNFLEKCFVKDPKNKWSVEMLLKHPFIKVDSFSLEKVHQPLLSPSPRTHFDFPDWASTIMSSLPSSLDSDEHSGWSSSPESRLRQLVTDKTPENWSELDGWISVRSSILALSALPCQHCGRSLRRQHCAHQSRTQRDLAAENSAAGDNAITVVVIAEALLEQCLQLSHGIHPTVVSDSLHKTVVKVVDIPTVKLSDRDSLVKSASTSLNRKVVSQYLTLLAPFAVDVVLSVVDAVKPDMA
ncbi:hypothetical protein VIGAN_01142900 [Vigna angularis var. angularis]|uniref:Protein kinase domain-containing protein n=1 Tax=Vigna angularis var. angularis TaxID=157739 RepID=A0A0S3QZX9_PHAAN|nr:hypothetical protein VIGAN_01142900 [Vigna angularis var. angularis]